MSQPIPIQKFIGGAEWSLYTRPVVEALTPKQAGDIANFLRAGIKTSSIKKINPPDHPQLQTLLGNLGLLEARARQ